jgi:hypothetical protein
MWPEGTPTSLWGGIYYNFGPVLGFLVVVIIGVAFLFLTGWLFTTPQSGPHVAPNGLTRLALCGVAVSPGLQHAGRRSNDVADRAKLSCGPSDRGHRTQLQTGQPLITVARVRAMTARSPAKLRLFT